MIVTLSTWHKCGEPNIPCENMVYGTKWRCLHCWILFCRDHMDDNEGGVHHYFTPALEKKR